MPRAARSRKSPSLTSPARGEESDSANGLDRYGEMRDFSRTPEPAPETPPPTAGPLTFVVQKHRATRLHYDFRLEWDGTMKSWPIPRGPSLDPADKRLAVMTEDHPLSYASFEGLIPKGQYGAGEVIVWDNGTYSPDEGGFCFDDVAEAERRMREGLAAGKISVHLRGKKLKGSWTLVKTQQDEKSWLAFKHRDEAVDTERDITEDDWSVISGLTIEDLQAGRLPDKNVEPVPLRPIELPGARLAPLPDGIEPMQATPKEGAFSDPAWLFEPKMDGIRALAFVRHGKVTLRTRKGNDVTRQYPALAAFLAKQPVAEAVFDGEIVSFDDGGRPSFERLQQRMNLTNDVEIREADRLVPVVFYAFDLPYVDGVDLTKTPLWLRKETLERVLFPSRHARYLEHFDVDGETAYHAAMDLGLEGLVAKRRDSVYESGRRSSRWLKLKGKRTDEFVVGGFTPGNGGRASSFGALIVGQYDAENRLIPCGRVGGGFDDRTLKEVRARLDPLVRKTTPFHGKPEGVTSATWTEPRLVVEVQFTEWTSDGNLRAPVFLRIRDDKEADDVRQIAAIAELAEGDIASATMVASRRSDTEPSDEDLQAEIASVLHQLETSKQSTTLEVGGHEIKLTNLNKVLWPAYEDQRPLTKRDLLVYLATAAPVLLPHLRDHPVTMTRYPNGIDAPMFYQKHYEAPPPFVHTVDVFADSRDQEFFVCNNLPTLMWLGQIANLALHISLARINPQPDAMHLPTTFTGSREAIEASVLNYPDVILFDLDPYIYAGYEKKGEEPELNRVAYRRTCEVALWLKELLDAASLSAFVKTSGATGLHVFVPIKRTLDYAAVRSVAETFGNFLVAAHPNEVTMEWRTENRTGKVFFDANQNARIKNLASAYSPRAKPGAPVSMPLRWNDLEKVYPTDFTILTAPERITSTGDLWAHILEAKQDVGALLGLDGD